MRRALRSAFVFLLAICITALAASAITGAGVLVRPMVLHPGGEIGWYITCRYLGARRAFTLRCSYEPLTPSGAGAVFERCSGCAPFAIDDGAEQTFRDE